MVNSSEISFLKQRYPAWLKQRKVPDTAEIAMVHTVPSPSTFLAWDIAVRALGIMPMPDGHKWDLNTDLSPTLRKSTTVVRFSNNIKIWDSFLATLSNEIPLGKRVYKVISTMDSSSGAIIVTFQRENWSGTIVWPYDVIAKWEDVTKYLVFSYWEAWRKTSIGRMELFWFKNKKDINHGS